MNTDALPTLTSRPTLLLVTVFQWDKNSSLSTECTMLVAFIPQPKELPFSAQMSLHWAVPLSFDSILHSETLPTYGTTWLHWLSEQAPREPASSFGLLPTEKPRQI